MSLDACAALVQRADPDRFLATMAAPLAARSVLFPIYAFNIEVSRAPWVTKEAIIAEMRLQWWRDALEEIAQCSPVRAHEVTFALAGVLDREGADLLDRLVHARRWDVYKDPFEDAGHFSEYLDATSGNLAWAAARALGCVEGEQAVRDMAWASGLANWFLAIPELEARGRFPLVDGRGGAVRDLAGEGLKRLARARPPKLSHPALLATWRAKAVLTQARRAPERVAAGALGQSEFSRKFTLLWRSLAGI
jgi:hypothetical protein